MPLTDVFCRNTKPEQKTRKYADGGGLFLQIEPKGGKYWRLAYSFAGKQRTLALGTYPAVSLADARQGRDDAKRLLRQGTDPSAQKRLDKFPPSQPDRERIVFGVALLACASNTLRTNQGEQP